MNIIFYFGTYPVALIVRAIQWCAERKAGRKTLFKDIPHHCSIQINNMIYEAVITGVRCHYIQPTDHDNNTRVIQILTKNKETGVQWVRKQINKPYDFLALLCDTFGIKKIQNKHEIINKPTLDCSEYVAGLLVITDNYKTFDSKDEPIAPVDAYNALSRLNAEYSAR